jgi:hypothetical protein
MKAVLRLLLVSGEGVPAACCMAEKTSQPVVIICFSGLLKRQRRQLRHVDEGIMLHIYIVVFQVASTGSARFVTRVGI